MTDKCLIWSSDVSTLKEAVSIYNLPILVKVDNGKCGSKDSDTFSQGDILKIESIQRISSVEACQVTRKVRGGTRQFVHTGEDILIPLRYPGLLKLSNPEAGIKVYNTVEELVSSKPRFVRTIEPITLHDGSVLEEKLDLEINSVRDGGIDVGHEDKTYTLQRDLQSRFLHLPDESEYTLKDVVDRYQLPQHVSFLENECPKLVTNIITEVISKRSSIEGTLELKNVIEQDLIIGYLKSDDEQSISPDTTNGDLNTSRMFVIPLQSELATEIDIVVCRTSQCDTEKYTAKYFTSGHEISTCQLDKTVYVNFKKTKPALPNTYTQDPTVQTPPETPPPIPPRNKHTECGDKPPWKPKTNVRTIPSPPTTPKEERKPLPPPRKELPSLKDQRQSERYVDLKTSPVQKTNYVKEKIEQYDAGFIEPSQRLKQISEANISATMDAEEDEQNIYDEPEQYCADTDEPELPNRPEVSLKKKTKEFLSKLKLKDKMQKLKSRFTSAMKSDQTTWREDDSDDLYEIPECNVRPKDDDNTYEYVSPPKIVEHPYTERSSHVADTNKDIEFSSLSVRELSDLLAQCGLQPMAKKCKEEQVDGRLFLVFSDHDLKILFSLDELQIKKVRMAQVGWKPKS